MRGRRRWPLIAVLLPVLLLESACQAPVAASGKPTGVPLARRFRRPVALVAVDGGRQRLVANRDSGTISRIDVAKRRVLDETSIGGRPSDLAVTPDGRRVLVAAAGRRQIVVLDLGGGRPAVVARVPLADEPAQLVVDPRGGWAGVTSPSLDFPNLALSRASAPPAAGVFTAGAAWPSSLNFPWGRRPPDFRISAARAPAARLERRGRAAPQRASFLRFGALDFDRRRSASLAGRTQTKSLVPACEKRGPEASRPRSRAGRKPAEFSGRVELGCSTGLHFFASRRKGN